MSVRLGINPIGWTNDCMPWLGDFISLDTCLAEAKQAGFSGVELGRKFPRSAEALGPILKRHGLQLVSGWYSANLLERDAAAEIAAMKDHLALLQALGAEVMVFAEATGEIINQVGAPISRRPKITSAAEWKRLGRFLGVRERDLPDRWADFGDYFDWMVRERLEHTDSVDDVFDALSEPPPPSVKGMSDPLWRLIRAPAAHGSRLGSVGLMPAVLRRKLGLPWSRSQQLELRAVGAASRRAGPLLPRSVKTFGPSYLRWRREAIARGEVASGVGSKFERPSAQVA